MRHPTLLSSLLVALIAVPALAAPPGRDPLSVAEPPWKGAPEALVTGGYREALAALQGLAKAHPEGAPLEISSPAPCILRVGRGDPATFGDVSKGFLLQITWIDLTRSPQVNAQAFGRKGGVGPALAATCAWLTGAPGLAVSTEVVALAGKPSVLRRSDHRAEEQPRLCLGGEVEPEALAQPLRALASACGASSRPSDEGR